MLAALAMAGCVFESDPELETVRAEYEESHPGALLPLAPAIEHSLVYAEPDRSLTAPLAATFMLYVGDEGMGRTALCATRMDPAASCLPFDGHERRLVASTPGFELFQYTGPQYPADDQLAATARLLDWETE